MYDIRNNDFPLEKQKIYQESTVDSLGNNNNKKKFSKPPNEKNILARNVCFLSLAVTIVK